MANFLENKKEKLVDAFYKACAFVDWDMIEEVMERKDWRWATINRVPNRQDMLNTCKRLFDDCIQHMNLQEEDEVQGSATGGFEVEVDRYGNEYAIEIKFYLSRASSLVEL